jgi:hypothetical protein
MDFHSARFPIFARARRDPVAEGRQPGLNLRAPPRIFAFAGFMAGVSLFALALLGTIVFLAGRHCGSEFNYYGCDAPTANIRNENSQFAPPPQQLSRGTRKRPSRF